MIKSYFKIAWRSLWKHKAYSIINMAGLSIGLTASLIVATVVFDELSYDKQWSKGDHIYRVLCTSNRVKGEQPMPVAFAGLGPSAKKDLPEVVDYCRMNVSKDRLILGNSPEGIAFKSLSAEVNIWNVLDFQITQGTPQKYVKGFVNLIITEKIRDQYFPNQNPIGKRIKNVPTYGKQQEYLITGVVKSIPQNTHLRADMITLAEYRADDNKVPLDGSATFCPQYLLLKNGTSITAFTKKLNNWYAKQLNNKVDYLFSFQPVKDVYLRSDFNGVQDVHGSIRNVYIFSGVAILLLLIACINFINLTVSRVFNRAKETGIRKVLGAEKLQLIVRFLAESLIFFMISFALALILYPLFIKPVETYLDHRLVLNLHNSTFLIISVCSVFIISLLTGLYPAWYLARPQPITILRNKVTGQVRLNLLKKTLIVGQFVISVTIIITSIVVHNQLNFISQKDLGFDKNNLLSIAYTSWGTKGADVKKTLQQMPGVSSVSITEWYPAGGGPGNMSTEVDLPGQNKKITVYHIFGDADLPSTLGLKVKSGRLLDPTLATDAMEEDSTYSPRSKKTIDELKTRSTILTAYTASLFGIKINKPITMGGNLVGIVEDFNSESLHNKLQPTLIQAISNPQAGNMLIRIKTGHEKEVLTAVSTLYRSYYPGKPFEYHWIGDLIDQQYKAEYKLQQLFTCFSILIVFLACLGLFGLVSFTAEQRVKEIGIRKVLGASIGDINTLISKDYLSLVFIAIIIASPIAWFFMQKWLQDFAYRVAIQWWVFALSCLIILVIAMLTISVQSIKAALANPVKSLRSE